MRNLLAKGEVLTVETEDDLYLGTVELVEGTVIVRSGFAGRPVVLDADAVTRISPVQEEQLLG